MSEAPTVEREMALAEKVRRLNAILRDCGSVVIGYSGGVDSAYLARAALDALGPDRVLAVTGRSASYPDVQYRTALAVVRAIGLPHLEIETRELDDPDYAANPRNRCYFCKRELYSRLTEIARARGYETVLDGSNADDRSDHRPGAVAARELGVRSPLQEAGLTKSEIRRLSRDRQLPTWDQPAAPCLASRIAYGLEVTPERLRKIEVAESALRALGDWGDLRVRCHGAWARVELDPTMLPTLTEESMRRRLTEAVRGAGFERVCLDLQGYRRGALNERAPGYGTGTGEGGTAPNGSGSSPKGERSPAGSEAGPGCGPAHAGVAGEKRRPDVEVAGTEGEIAVLRAADAAQARRLLTERRRAVKELRSLGFKHVALGLS